MDWCSDNSQWPGQLTNPKAIGWLMLLALLSSFMENSTWNDECLSHRSVAAAQLDPDLRNRIACVEDNWKEFSFGIAGDGSFSASIHFHWASIYRKHSGSNCTFSMRSWRGKKSKLCMCWHSFSLFWRKKHSLNFFSPFNLRLKFTSGLQTIGMLHLSRIICALFCLIPDHLWWQWD